MTRAISENETHFALAKYKGNFLRWGKWAQVIIYYEENKSKIAIFRVTSSQIIGGILKFSTSSSHI
jgi:hypothetical protein